MFSQGEAESMCSALMAFGYDAWPQPLVQGGWGVWCETGGLLLQDRDELTGWLSRRWASEREKVQVSNG